MLACCAAAAIAWTAASGQGDSQSYADGGPVAVSGAVSGGTEQAGGGSSQPAKGASTRVGDHAHQWVEGVETVHHDAETEQVEVPATYKSVIEDETVCNTCQAVVTGKASEHQAQTGHSSFTTNVPVEKQVVDQEAHTEDRVVKRGVGRGSAERGLDMLDLRRDARHRPLVGSLPMRGATKRAAACSAAFCLAMGASHWPRAGCCRRDCPRGASAAAV